jgi:hypothetical protein
MQHPLNCQHDLDDWIMEVFASGAYGMMLDRRESYLDILLMQDQDHITHLKTLLLKLEKLIVVSEMKEG